MNPKNYNFINIYQEGASNLLQSCVYNWIGKTKSNQSSQKQ